MTGTLNESWLDPSEIISPSVSDIYFTNEYYRLGLKATEQIACFLFEDGPDRWFLPLVVRPIPGFLGYWDAESAYGYGGPLCTTDDAHFLKVASEAFLSWLKKKRIICVFLRFHSLLGNQRFMLNSDQVKTFFDRFTVAIDLTKSESEIWETEIHSKHRNVIRKAIQNGLSVTFDENFADLSEFVSVYKKTMDRLGAHESYYFDSTYFEQFRTLFSRRACLVSVTRQNQLLSGCLLFWGTQFGHYHLSGSDPEFMGLYPNNLMLWESAKYLKLKGLRSFHLGGGTNSDPENSLYKFKQRFSSSRLEFFLGKIISDAEVYAEIRNAWSQKSPDKVSSHGHLLQSYRY